jgi:uncharacterized protein (DUF305 family)
MIKRISASALLTLLVISGCRTTSSGAASVGAGPPAQRGTDRVSTGGHPTATTRPRHNAADVRFMQEMIIHHGQALVMTALVPARTSRPEMRLLAERIDVSQRDEIALMRQWLEPRGEPVANLDTAHAHHAIAAHQMPGMATPADLAALRQASGTQFDRLFLQLMIRHHEGALTMVARLFGTPGATQETETYRFATDVDADQRAEIARMRALLATLPPRVESGRRPSTGSPLL